ncbi:sushi, von Willebrand factor type A, EGF and pentraxin domain-containing protein 1-like isoform X4 [Acropora millepora]|uniref:sushi, von Willebrand factor type A, EGF and pentraxin domain-containing protein 1-like isoform X4 n=1 Tax=Acropora millepora TaxID=45264 RepID=UPI001CF37097|nr:sushi, von Willebrand factor type A, EGF and pentraxin domain-containing protein 1-like isoform X4 [Acropora millepora]
MDAYSSILLLIVTLYPHSSLQSEEKCNSALGMESGDIPDESVKASSQLDSNHHPFFGRLHGSKAWCSAVGDDDPYIEIKLHEEHSITALSTQGSSTDGVWSSKYRIEYHTGGKWTQYKKELPGNRNLHREKRNNLDPEILTKSIRIFPKDPFSMIVPDVKYKCLRVELYGCLPPADCRDPGRPINGERTGDEFNHGSRISFSCKQGFLLIGNSSSVCNMGKWSNALPQCKGTCEDPGIPENGNRKGIGNFNDGDTIEFSCNRNYSLFGSSISRCLNGRWSSALPKCKAVCTDPGIPFNGNRIGNDFSEGQMVAFSCDSNFTLVGPSLVFCVAGQWDATTPTCKASCSNPGSPEHGNIIGSDFGHGGQVTFLCLPKYSLSGSATMTCRDGKWSSALPVCKAYCMSPGSPHNGTTHGSNFHHNKRISFSCLPGFMLIGHSTAVCINGKWSASVPRCIVVCPDPGAPINGSRVGDSFLDGQTVAFRCHESHTLVGQQVLRCLSGRWSSDVPECKAHCLPPVAPSNGRVFASNSNNEHGTRLRFACNSGYKGASIVQCDDGKWNSSLPLCEDIDECTEGLSECFENAVCRNIPGSYQCECKRGFVKRGGKCLIGIEKCKDPGIPRNGARRGDQFFHKARVFFLCNKGFTLDGNNSITCQEGEWSSNLPYCRAKCANPGALSNGFRRGGDFRHGKKVTFGCRRGFRLKGVNIITCNNGNWSNPLPVCADANECAEGLSNCNGNTVCLNSFGTYRCKCKEGYFQIGRTCFKKCADPGIPLNGARYGKQFFHQRRVSFSCNRGYTLVGNVSMSCQEGEWNSALPQCKENCASPGALSNGFRRGGDFRHGKKVTFGCRRGFRLKGVNIITCNNGNWSNPLPVCADANECAEGLSNCNGNTVCLNTLGTYRCKCKEGYFQIGRTCFKKCADPGIPLNGKRYGKQFFHQRRVSFSCNQGYTLVGNVSMSCQEGEWNSALPQCKERCADPGALSNGFRRGGDYRHGKKVTFGCRRGFRLKGVNIITCNDGTWSNPRPVCSDSASFCRKPPIPLHAYMLTSQAQRKIFSDGERLSYRCNLGFSPTGVTFRWCKNGAWSRLMFTCNVKSCGEPETPENGRINSYLFTYNSAIEYSCDQGYTLVGSKSRVCQHNQTWTGTVPLCTLINCGRLPTPRNGEKKSETSTFLHGQVRFACKGLGFKIEGSQTRTCLESGQWSGQQPECKLITCPDPGVPVHATSTIRKGFSYLGSVEFHCNANYKLEGVSQIFCKRDGTWSRPRPKCFAPCSNPGKPPNGGRTGQGFTHGKTVKFYCKRNYRLVGRKQLTCNNGNWQGQKPRCRRKNKRNT